MDTERIHGLGDPRVADYRDVREPELVRGRGLFVAEGRLVVRRLIEDARYEVRSVLVTEAARASLAAALSRLPPEVPVFVCAAEEFRGLTGYNIHRGCLALARRPPDPSVDAIARGARRLVVLEEIANPDNIGGAFRNAAAFGVGGVVLSPGCSDPFYRKAIRTSMGATLRVPFARDERWPEALATIRAGGFTIVALTPREPAEDLAVAAARLAGGRIALVLGTEGAGLTPAVEDAADVRVRIPIRPEVDSLNVAVATGIALYAFR